MARCCNTNGRLHDNLDAIWSDMEVDQACYDHLMILMTRA